MPIECKKKEIVHKEWRAMDGSAITPQHNTQPHLHGQPLEHSLTVGLRHGNILYSLNTQFKIKVVLFATQHFDLLHIHHISSVATHHVGVGQKFFRTLQCIAQHELLGQIALHIPYIYIICKKNAKNSVKNATVPSPWKSNTPL